MLEFTEAKANFVKELLSRLEFPNYPAAPHNDSFTYFLGRISGLLTETSENGFYGVFQPDFNANCNFWRGNSKVNVEFDTKLTKENFRAVVFERVELVYEAFNYKPFELNNTDVVVTEREIILSNRLLNHFHDCNICLFDFEDKLGKNWGWSVADRDYRKLEFDSNLVKFSHETVRMIIQLLLGSINKI